MAKPGPKEQRLRDLRELPPHHKMMVEDGCPPACLRTGAPPKIKRRDGNAGVTLAPPIAVQKAIDAEFADDQATPETTVPETTQQEKTMTKATPKTKKTAAPKKAPTAKKTAPAAAPKAVDKPKTEKVTAKPEKTGGRPDGLREGSKQAMMLDLALAPDGATEKAICKKLGWKACLVTLRRVAEKVGAKLEGKKNAAGETVWFAAMPTKKAA